MVVTPNPEIILEALSNEHFASVLRASSLAIPDGVGLAYAITALTDKRLQNRHTGIDTLLLLAKLCKEEDKKMLLLGGVDLTAQKAAKKLKQDYPGLRVEGLQPGKVRSSDTGIQVKADVLTQIEQSKPDVLVVALGHEKQERFMAQYQKRFPTVKISIGVGGALDTIIGKNKRAPSTWRHLGLEWVWRLWAEPVRYKRIFNAVIVFPIRVIKETLYQDRFMTAFLRVMKDLKNISK